MMHFLDTDTITQAHLGHRKVASRIERIGEQNVATTIVTAIEIIRGRHEYLLKAADGAQLLRAQQLLNASEEMLMDRGGFSGSNWAFGFRSRPFG